MNSSGNTRSSLFLNMSKCYLCIVLCMLLHIGCIESNPGSIDERQVNSSLSSANSDLSLIDSFCKKFHNSVSFLHLNVQSLFPKLDIIAAEYEDFDILSFSETWLNENITDDSIKLLNFQLPFRKDRGPDKLGGGWGYSLCKRQHSGK